MDELKEDNRAQKVVTRNYLGLPQRLWEFLCLESKITESTRWADISSAKLNRLTKKICSNELQVEGKTTYKEEFVTAGGISLKEISHTTMESKIVPGLYFAGEVLDVDGVTGGFNFQHAWTSGFIAGKAIAKAAVSSDPAIKNDNGNQGYR